MAKPSLLHTSLCDLLEIDVPIVLAPIGRVSGPALAAAVANAGGLGMLGLSFADEGEIRKALRVMNDLTDRAFGINLILQWDQRERLAVCLEAGVRNISYSWSNVPVVVDAVAPTPVVAAGGIGDGRGLAAALALGAQAGWMGTRFVVADESLAHSTYKDRIVAAKETDAAWSTGVFDAGFSDAPVRTLDNTRSKLGAMPGPLRRAPDLVKVASSHTDPTGGLVSGATYTSEAYAQSLQAALDQAGMASAIATATA